MSSVTDILLVHSKELRELKHLDSDAELSWLRKENARLKNENEKITERVNNLSFVLADLQDKAARANKEKASLMTSIRLLFKDLESTQPINVNRPEIVHDQQLGTFSDANDTNIDRLINIPTKTVFHNCLLKKRILTRRFVRLPTLPKTARSEPAQSAIAKRSDNREILLLKL